MSEQSKDIINNLIYKLHPLEQKVIRHISNDSLLSEIVGKEGLTEVEIMRALQWLENKAILKLEKKEGTKITLGKNGLQAIKMGLAEKRLLIGISKREEDGLSIQQAQKELGLDNFEINFSIGQLRRKNAISLNQDKIIRITKEGLTLLKKGFFEEKVIEKISNGLYEESLDKDERLVISELSKRKDFIEKKVEKDRIIVLTSLGHEIKKKSEKLDLIDKVSPEVIKSGEWKKKDFRHIDVEINVPKISIGKKHLENEAIEFIKRIWIEMGFKEISGDYIQSAFWDLDSLFVPQDHPAREMQDTFYIKGSQDVPKNLFANISDIHQNGLDKKSKGWGEKLDLEVSKKMLLRTHCTVLSARTLARLKKEDLPNKFFSIGKVFRNEALDWSHLFEFYQIEGIVISDDVNFSCLKGYLREFYKKMGYDKVRIKPSFFPYTEPSAEVEVYLEEKKSWMELGGAGMFRPEVTKALFGREIPVLAWGLGMGRIIMPYYEFSDIRDIYKNDLSMLRNIKKFSRV